MNLTIEDPPVQNDFSGCLFKVVALVFLFVVCTIFILGVLAGLFLMNGF